MDDDLRLSDFWWRIENLYTVVNSSGIRVPFEPNAVQRDYLERQHIFSIVLKSRQLGFSTLALLQMLDCVLFNSSVSCGFVSDNLSSAKRLFRTKVLEVFNHLPKWLQEARPLVSCDKTSLSVAHPDGEVSSISVDTTLRSGTMQMIHISELSKIDAAGGDKSEEVLSGSMQSGLRAVLTIESTARGARGSFYEMCQRAMRHNGVLSPMTPKFFFYPWTWSDDCRLDSEYPVTDGIDWPEGVDESQKRWYSAKFDQLGRDRSLMFREYPSTPEQAFESVVEGAYYEHALGLARVDDLSGYDGVVHCAWDLGMGDSTAMVFFGLSENGDILVLDHYENRGEGLHHYVGKLAGLRLGAVIWPHDGSVRDFTRGGLTRAEVCAIEYGVMPHILIREPVIDGINRCRRMMGRVVFDRDRTHGLRSALGAYKENERTGKPEHGEESHLADAFRYAVQSLEDMRIDLYNFEARGFNEILERNICIL